MYIYQNGYYVRPKVDPGARVPRRPTAFQVMPWTESQSKDTLKRKPGYMKDFEAVLRAHQEHRAVPPAAQLRVLLRRQYKDPVTASSVCGGLGVGPVLRIREDGITLGSSPRPFMWRWASSRRLSNLTRTGSVWSGSGRSWRSLRRSPTTLTACRRRRTYLQRTCCDHVTSCDHAACCGHLPPRGPPASTQPIATTAAGTAVVSARSVAVVT